MQQLGHTRSSYQRDHILHTPDAFVRAPLPGMEKATAIVHVGPAAGARFTQYTAEFEAGGALGPVRGQRFIYVLEGDLTVTLDGEETSLPQDTFAYIPEEVSAHVTAAAKSRAAVIEKMYERDHVAAPPEFYVGDERAVEPQPLMGDKALQVRTLVPATPAFDFAVNTMTYDPGATLPMVEMHVMEHGLLMLEGGGIYRLGEHWYPVTAGDFIWMGPYCPQWFGALGKTPAKYLIYKDWNRHPL